jgi:hypothetical protein
LQQIAGTQPCVEAEGGHAEGASLAPGHAICKLELLRWGCSSDHRGVCSVRRANRTAGCSRGGGAGRGGGRQLYEHEVMVSVYSGGGRGDGTRG